MGLAPLVFLVVMLSHTIRVTRSIVALFNMAQKPKYSRKTVDLSCSIRRLYYPIYVASDGLVIRMPLDWDSVIVF